MTTNKELHRRIRAFRRGQIVSIRLIDGEWVKNPQWNILYHYDNLLTAWTYRHDGTEWNKTRCRHSIRWHIKQLRKLLK